MNNYKYGITKTADYPQDYYSNPEYNFTKAVINYPQAATDQQKQKLRAYNSGFNEGASNGGMAAGKGFISGATGVTRFANALAQPLVNGGMKFVQRAGKLPYQVYDIITGSNATADYQRQHQNARNYITGKMNQAQDYMHNLNKHVRDNYQYSDPNFQGSAPQQMSYWGGYAIPWLLSSKAGNRLLSPVQAKDVATVASQVAPNLGITNYLKWLAGGSSAANAVRMLTNVGRFIPSINATTGIFQPQKGQSPWATKLRTYAAQAAPIISAAFNPAAGFNMLYQNHKDVVQPRTQAAANITLDNIHRFKGGNKPSAIQDALEAAGQITSITPGTIKGNNPSELLQSTRDYLSTAGDDPRLRYLNLQNINVPWGIQKMRDLTGTRPLGDIFLQTAGRRAMQQPTVNKALFGQSPVSVQMDNKNNVDYKQLLNEANNINTPTTIQIQPR